MSVTSDLMQIALLMVLASIPVLISKSVRRVISSIFSNPGRHTIIVRHAGHISIESVRPADMPQALARTVARAVVTRTTGQDQLVPLPRGPGRHRSDRRLE